MKSTPRIFIMLLTLISCFLFVNQAIANPTVSIQAPSTPQNGAFDVTITFSENVIGFVREELVVTGRANARLTDWTEVSGSEYRAQITPAQSGDVIVYVPAWVAEDAHGNLNFASPIATIIIDKDPPTVTIYRQSTIHNGSFSVRVSFSEPVTGFSDDDVTLGGNISASISGVKANSESTYSVDVHIPSTELTLISDGRITIGINSGVAQDKAGNTNTAATTQTVDIETVPPTATIDVPTTPQNAAFSVTVTFSEGVFRFVQDDLQVGGNTNATVSEWTRTPDGITYTALITPTTSGELTLDVPENVAVDLALNNNVAADQQTVTIDMDPPEPDIVVDSIQTFNFWVSVQFGEPVTDFEQDELQINGELQVHSWYANSDNSTYYFEFRPTSNQVVTLNVDAGVATDTAGNLNTAALERTVIIDFERPTVTISVPELIQNGVFTAEVTFSEDVTGFSQNDLQVTGNANPSITEWRVVSPSHYKAEITPAASGQVTLDIAENVALDLAERPNTAAAQQTVKVDIDAPTVAISVPTTPQNGIFIATVTFSEAVTGFVQSELVLGDTATAEITAWTETSPSVYTAEITPRASGSLTLDVAAGVATDPARNGNTAAAQQAVTIDIDVPTVAISDPGTHQNGVFTVTVTFSEAVAGFVREELVLGGTATAEITEWTPTNETVYTAEITPTTSGSLTLNVAAGVATDPATNGNTAAAQQAVTIDMDAPTVAISDPGTYQNGVFTVTVTFSEAVTGFVQEELVLGGTATAEITEWTPTITAWTETSPSVYTAEITPTTSGSLTLDVAAGVATDPARNGNTAAAQQAVTIDMDAPTVTITVPGTDQNGVFDVTITFSEPVIGFIQDDFEVSGTGDFTITSWDVISEAVYEAEITPTTSGVIVFDVPANVATDRAGNPNRIASPNSFARIDLIQPSVRIDAPTTPQNSPFNVTITFDEIVNGMEQDELQLGGSAAVNITDWERTVVRGETVWTAEITPTGSGSLTLDVAAGVATDPATNENTAAAQQAVTIDVDRPTVEITVPTGAQMGVFDVTVTFSEAVTGFVQADLEVSGGTAPITEWTVDSASQYTAEITPTGIDELLFDIDANVATDEAGNGNIAAAQQRVSLDKEVNVPDAFLATALRNALELTDIEPIMASAMATLTNFTPINNGIRNLTGLEYATQLESLDLTSNFVTNIQPLTNLTNLTSLRLTGNSLGGANTLDPLSGLTNLETLRMVRCGITNISALSGLTNLTFLELHINRIEDVSSLENLTSLNTLRLLQNSIQDFRPLRRLKAQNPDVTIDVSPLNSRPKLPDDNTTFEVAEDTTLGSDVGTSLAATDGEEDPLTYRLTGTDADLFTITDSGQLQTNTTFNYETKATYTLTVNVSDGYTNGTDTLNITINVTNQNEAPVFREGDTANRSFYVGTPGNRNVGPPISATDPDSGTSLQYSMSGTGSLAFGLISSNGQLRTRPDLDYSLPQTFTFTMTVTDGQLTDTITVNVSLLANAIPVFTEGASTTRSVNEGTASGENIGSPVSATDANNSSLTYILSGTDAASFDIVRTTGQLQTKAALDYETKLSYAVIVTATDSYGASDIINVTINVNDVTEETTNVAPVFADGDTATRTCWANQTQGTAFDIPVGATDANDDTLTYSLSGTDASKFRIDTTNGQLRVPTTAEGYTASHYTAGSTYTVTVSVDDGNDETDSISVTINVKSKPTANRAPVFSEGSSTTRDIWKHEALGTAITGYVTATDADNDTLSYSLSDAGNASLFDVDAITGELSVTTNQNVNPVTTFVVGREFTVTVLVSDGRGGTDSIVVNMTVKDMTPAPSALSLQQQVSQTVLFANFPNPFNPETWIPYQLANPANVSLTIYNMRGIVVREISLGHQPAGIYQSRARAIHWDGRNEFGERVASGVYFYVLKAGKYTATRKMLIRK